MCLRRSPLSLSYLPKKFKKLPGSRFIDIKGVSIYDSPNVEGVVIMKLNQPRAKNAITYEMYDGITQAFPMLSEDPKVKAIILTGTGDYYSSGNDLKNFFSFGSPKSLALEAGSVCFDFVNSFVDCKKPIIAAVNGPSIGISATSLGLCDKRFCVPKTTFYTPFKLLAQAPEACSSYMFPKIMGKDLAQKMLAENYTMSAQEAKKCNFIDEIVENPEKLMETAEDACKKIIAQGDKFERFCTKNRPLLHEVNAMEIQILIPAWTSKECFQALEDFMTKKNQRPAAYLFKTLNKTRFIWDR